ncbi:nucleotide-diphospho-sugar transferase [Martensiomyces pterosporus]|nr:nucleotide-diphospho-sugar transferase [Martensiomyces pterosporus]
MFDIERRFNDRFRYPYVFLSEEPLPDEFKESVRWMAGGNKAKVEFGLITEHWGYPRWIDVDRAENAAQDWADANEQATDRAGWRHMVRYWAGPFALHPLLRKYQYVWRLEAGSHYTCDFEYDPFVYMQNNRLSYGFAISMEEMPDAVPSIWGSVLTFIKENLVLALESQNSLGWLNDKKARKGQFAFNRCQFLSNFEILDLDFVRSHKYQKLFDHLDRDGGIYYERWTDASVRSLAAALFLDSASVHWFDDIGYKHDRLHNCPQSTSRQMRCHCDPKKSTHLVPMSCAARWNSTSTSIDPRSLLT